jgi:hypothetical protein
MSHLRQSKNSRFQMELTIGVLCPSSQPLFGLCRSVVLAAQFVLRIGFQLVF